MQEDARGIERTGEESRGLERNQEDARGREGTREESRGRERVKGYKVISTKVSEDKFEMLHLLADKKGMTVYEMFQMVADTFIRYMSDRHNLSPDMEKAMSLFEHLVGWKGALNHADPTAEMTISEATYYMTDPKKKGVRAVHVNRPFFGEWSQSLNIVEIVERTIEMLMPERYRRLRLLAIEMDCKSMVEVLDHLLDLQDMEHVNAELRKDFEDCERSDWGKKPWEAPFKRKHHKSPDSIGDSKADDFRPFGEEW